MQGVKIRSFKIKTVAAPAEFKCQTNTEAWKTFSLFLVLLAFQLSLSYLPAPFSESNPAGGFNAYKAYSPQDQIQGVSRELRKWPYTLSVMGPPGAVPRQIIHTRVSCLIRRGEKRLADTANVCKQKVRTNLASFDRVGLKIRGLWSLTWTVALSPVRSDRPAATPAGTSSAPGVVIYHWRHSLRTWSRF